MKNSLAILSLAMAFSACQQSSNYTQQSPEIETVKAVFDAYEAGDFEGQRIYYAENAQIFYNTPESKPSTLDQILTQQQADLEGISAYSIDFTDDAIEMVTTDKGETWVNVWAEWKATMTATGQQFVIPMHETFQFVDGKIVKEFGYWDNSPIMQAFMEYEMSQKATADTTAQQ